MNKKFLVSMVYATSFNLTPSVETPDVLHTGLKDMLKAGIVKFTYEKKDGTQRNAIGTLNALHIPASDLPQSEGGAASEPKPDNPNTQKYYDLEAKAWRMFTISKLIAVY
jgi:hypothetical protein